MENDKKDRISEVQEHIFSGALARTERKEPESEPVEDTSYRVQGADVERSRKVLADFLGGKIIGKEGQE